MLKHSCLNHILQPAFGPMAEKHALGDFGSFGQEKPWKKPNSCQLPPFSGHPFCTGGKSQLCVGAAGFGASNSKVFLIRHRVAFGDDQTDCLARICSCRYFWLAGVPPVGLWPQ